MSEILDLFNNTSGTVSAFNKNTPIGTTVAGTITSVDLWNVRDFVTGQPKTWDDGNPQQQLRILIQADPGTWQPTNEDDTGTRAIYVKAWNPHLGWLRDAVQATGAQAPEVGGHLTAVFSEERPSKFGNAMKVYAYQYRRPATGVEQVFTAQPTAPQQVAQQPQPTQPAQPAAQPNYSADTQIIKLIQGGIPDDQILQILGSDGVTAAQIAQIRAGLGGGAA